MVQALDQDDLRARKEVLPMAAEPSITISIAVAISVSVSVSVAGVQVHRARAPGDHRRAQPKTRREP